MPEWIILKHGKIYIVKVLASEKTGHKNIGEGHILNV